MSDRLKGFFDEFPLFLLDHESLDILDANQKACSQYGYTRDEFRSMNVSELGEKWKRTDLVPINGNSYSSDKIWIHHTKSGDKLYVQFTHHVFNYRGNPAKLAIAHDVSDLVDEQVKNRHRYPQVDTPRNNSPLAEIEWNSDKTVKNWSEKAQDLFGWSEEEVVGVEGFFEEFVHEDELEAAHEIIDRTAREQRPGYTVESRVNTKDGKVLVCEWYNSFIYNEAGEWISVYSLVHDVSSRKESEELFRALSEESLVGVYLIQDNVFKYVNPRFATIFKYEKEEIENKMGPLDLAHPEDREMVRENIRKRIEGEAKSMEYNFRCLTGEGEEIHVDVYGTRITYMGKPAVIGTLVDISQTKHALQRYRASVESFEDLFDSISDAIYIQDPEGRFLQVNEGAEKMYGYDRDYFVGKTPEFLAAPGKVDLDQTLEYHNKALRGERQQFNWWGRRKNGEIFPKEVLLNPGTYFGEQVVIAIARDISERYEAEVKLRKNEELFRQLFQNAPIAIALMDKHQEIDRINEAFNELFGYSLHEVKGLNIDQLLVPEDEMDSGLALSEKIFRGESGLSTGRRLTKDGSLVDVLIYGVPVIVDGKTVSIYGIYVDITERKQAEERIRQSLKEKEVLLAEIHHRVKNNLAVITGLLELQSYNTDSDEARNVLRESQMRVNSIALIHEKLYQNENLSQISFDVYLEELIDVITESLELDDKDIHIYIKVDPVQLTITQAIPCGLILNELITNSYKHAFKEMDSGAIEVSIEQCGDQLCLRVADNGVGLPGSLDLDDPTTLGLTLIQTLCMQLNGEYSLTNQENGTQFEMEFQLEK